MSQDKPAKQSRQRSRRRFLQTGAAATTAPLFVPSTAFAKKGKWVAPSDRLRIGCISCGDLWWNHHSNVLLFNGKVKDQVEIVAVCDVDRIRRERGAKKCSDAQGKPVAAYEDFRQLLDRTDIDAAFISTPDHWHALISIYAMETGKDVYCEKPLTLTIDEGIRMTETARRYGTIFQTGSQQRSEGPFKQAVALAWNGMIGKISRLDTHIGNVNGHQSHPASPPPPELNWDMWLGPAPYRDYVAHDPVHTGYGHNGIHYLFRWISDFSGGKMTDWGAHHNDFAQWVLDADKSGPVKVQGKGEFFTDGPWDVAREFDVQYTYANGVEVHCHSGGENGIKITGSDGFIFVSRGRIEMQARGKTYSDNREKIKAGEHLDIYKEFKREEMAKKIYEVPSGSHHVNWLECVRNRDKLPICDVEVGHRSASVCHLGNIALQLGRELTWDPAKEAFVGDEQAQRMVRRPMRSPWRI